MHRGDADIARQAQQRIVVAEQPVERVGRRQHQQIVRPPSPLVAPQQVGRAEILAALRRLDQQFGQRHRIAEAEIEALAGDRMDGVRRIAHQRQARVEIAMRVQRAERIAPAAARRRAPRRDDRRGGGRSRGRSAASSSASMRCAIARALGPDDGGDVRRAAFLGIGAGAHRQLREGAGRQEVLERRVVVRLLVADRADDAGLVVRQAGDGDAGRPRAAASCGPPPPPPAGSRCAGPPAMRTVAPSSRRSTSAAAGANTRSAGSACMCAFSATRRLRASTIWPNGASPRASRWSKCRNSGEARRPRRPSLTRMSRIGQAGSASRSHSPACLQQAARAGGNGVGAAIERRVLHRRQRGAVHHDRGDARARPAGRPACRRPGRLRPRTPRPTAARPCRDSGAAGTAPASQGIGASASSGVCGI